jgi:hypothetical protein
MSRCSRPLAAALLLAALAVPASLQASGLPRSLPAAHDGGSLSRANAWSLDGLLRMIHKLIGDRGALDPRDGANVGPSQGGSSGDSGGGLDPTGGANSGRHAPTHRPRGN